MEKGAANRKKRFEQLLVKMILREKIPRGVGRNNLLCQVGEERDGELHFIKQKKNPKINKRLSPRAHSLVKMYKSHHQLRYEIHILEIRFGRGSENIDNTQNLLG